jgi:hypothetical protein
VNVAVALAEVVANVELKLAKTVIVYTPASARFDEAANTMLREVADGIVIREGFGPLTET